MAGAILGRHRHPDAVAFNGGVDPHGKIDRKMSGVERAIRRALPDRHFLEYGTSCPGRPGFAKLALVWEHVVEVTNYCL